MTGVGVYTRQVQGDSIVFQVVPAEGPKFWPLIAIGVAVLVLGFMSHISILHVFLVAAACIALGWYDLRPIEHKTSSTFRVNPSEIEVLGEKFPRNEIDDLTVASGFGSDDSLLARIGTALWRFQPGKM